MDHRVLVSDQGHQVIRQGKYIIVNTCHLKVICVITNLENLTAKQELEDESMHHGDHMDSFRHFAPYRILALIYHHYCNEENGGLSHLYAVLYKVWCQLYRY